MDENNWAEVLWDLSCWPTSQTQWWTIARIDVSFPADSNISKKEHTKEVPGGEGTTGADVGGKVQSGKRAL